MNHVLIVCIVCAILAALAFVGCVRVLLAMTARLREFNDTWHPVASPQTWRAPGESIPADPATPSCFAKGYAGPKASQGGAGRGEGR